jgi:hypothetical protein
MSIRLQVLIPDSEMEEIRRVARREKIAVGEWVRRTLREARAGRPAQEAAAKVKAIRKAAQHSFPTADIGQMLAEIEKGYQS